jgi:hypothetical protein
VQLFLRLEGMLRTRLLRLQFRNCDRQTSRFSRRFPLEYVGAEALVDKSGRIEFGFTHVSMVLELSSWRHRVSGICFHGFIGAGVLSLIDGSDWTDSKGEPSGTILLCGDCSPTFSREIKNGLAPKAPKITSSIARAVNLSVRSCCFSARCTSLSCHHPA